MIDLKPCPFCGEPEHLIIEHLEGTIIHPAHRIRCDNCGASSGFTDKDCRANWNARATQPPAVGVDVSEEMVERAFRKSKSGCYETEREQMRAILHAALRTGGGA